MAAPVSLHVSQRRSQFSQMASSKFKKPNAGRQPLPEAGAGAETVGSRLHAIVMWSIANITRAKCQLAISNRNAVACRIATYHRIVRPDW